jgi:SAM-dependent methyltransferase
MEFFNVYEDETRAESYAKLEFPDDYYLAFRDIPGLVHKHVRAGKAIDFGCGAGRSTRFIKSLGFEVIGIDISENMIKSALEADPEGDYRLIGDGEFDRLEQGGFDLVFAAFTFDNIPGVDRRTELLLSLGGLLNDEGKIILLDSTPDIYTHEWASFSTKDYPENKSAKSGDIVKIITTDVEDKRPVEDVIWFDEDYLELFESAGLELVESYKPLGKEDEPFEWINEMEIPPWIIYIVKRGSAELA